ncbi:MAG: hypothetical protein ACXADY_19825 [Candidatus Hodarchaeales archaeon]
MDQKAEETIGLFFPKSTSIETIALFLTIIYPNTEFRPYKWNNRQLIITDDIWGKINTGVISLFSGYLSLGTKAFEVIKDREWLKLTSFVDINTMSIFDSWIVLLNQFNDHSLLNVLEYVEEGDYSELYFKSLHSLIERDVRTASMNLGFIAESFSKNVLSNLIVDSLKGIKGITEIRRYVNTHDSWNDLINVTKQIQKEISLPPEKLEILDTMFFGFHLLRKLRNRSLHPNENFSIEQAHSMLSLILFLVDEVKGLID